MDHVFEVHSLMIEEEEEISIVENVESEGEVSSQDADLVRWVRANDLLWNDKNPRFKDAAAKSNAWASIGASLHPTMTGEEAEKRFKNLRTVFARHHKAVRESQPRSGAGAGPIFVPKWLLYKDLLFLTDVITPRTPAKKARVPPSVASTSRVPADLQWPTLAQLPAPVRSLLQPASRPASPTSPASPASPAKRRWDSTDSTASPNTRSPWLADIPGNGMSIVFLRAIALALRFATFTITNASSGGSMSMSDRCIFLLPEKDKPTMGMFL